MNEDVLTNTDTTTRTASSLVVAQPHDDAPDPSRRRDTESQGGCSPTRAAMGSCKKDYTHHWNQPKAASNKLN